MFFKEKQYVGHLAEISQTLEIRMALCRKVGKYYQNQHKFVLCRDFLGDVLHAIENKKTNRIYGFSYPGKTRKLDDKSVVLAIKFPNTESLTNFIVNMATFGKQLEEQLKIDIYENFYLEYERNLIVIECPLFWRKTIANISLLTFLFKCFGYKLDQTKSFVDAVKETKGLKDNWDGTKSEATSTEAGYMTSVAPHWDKLIKHWVTINNAADNVSGWPAHKNSIDTIHNSCGFQAVVKFHLSDNKISDEFYSIKEVGHLGE